MSIKCPIKCSLSACCTPGWHIKSTPAVSSQLLADVWPLRKRTLSLAAVAMPPFLQVSYEGRGAAPAPGGPPQGQNPSLHAGPGAIPAAPRSHRHGQRAGRLAAPPAGPLSSLAHTHTHTRTHTPGLYKHTWTLYAHCGQCAHTLISGPRLDFISRTGVFFLHVWNTYSSHIRSQITFLYLWCHIYLCWHHVFTSSDVTALFHPSQTHIHNVYISDYLTTIMYTAHTHTRMYTAHTRMYTRPHNKYTLPLRPL